MSNYDEFSIISVLNNVLIIDQLFKANGRIHKICSCLQKENERYSIEEAVNGLDFVRNPDDYSFMIYSENFRFKIEEYRIHCFYGDFGIQFKPKTGESVENFKQLLLTLINIASEQKIDNIEQFVDLHNMTYI